MKKKLLLFFVLCSALDFAHSTDIVDSLAHILKVTCEATFRDEINNARGDNQKVLLFVQRVGVWGKKSFSLSLSYSILFFDNSQPDDPCQFRCMLKNGKNTQVIGDNPVRAPPYSKCATDGQKFSKVLHPTFFWRQKNFQMKFFWFLILIFIFSPDK